VVQIVRAKGGTFTLVLEIIHGVAAYIPNDRVKAIEEAGARVYPDKATYVAGGLPSVYFPEVAGVEDVWANGLTGDGVAVAVVDTGINYPGSASQIVARYDDVDNDPSTLDPHGHGSYMASMIANNKKDGDGNYLGMAPGANLVDVRVLDAEGKGTAADVIEGLDWILANHAQYNIRIVNLSLISGPTGPYWDDPINQAVERLWDADLVVVVAAGNAGPDAVSIAVQGNDPFVITVGSFTDNYTPFDDSDDYVTPFSGAGPTEWGFVKPDVIAPGAHIVSIIKKNTTRAGENSDRHDHSNFYSGS
jgi:serine protease AprX